ncbi:hypothetical protein BUALT_Bualt03G0048100 [Buddleja alternifolia]|uniref:Uncharacterized protein n=1 Tax=Buddleja alternifolia TaxID=168488 RepID=A0AAV6Y1Z7_9LAMI|nr:hypothetical protein BUALT_Bualt03G0048100 [Buddleja alternifolia]
MGVADVIVVLMLIISSLSKSASGCYESIISFGDSLADTGNLLLLSPSDKLPRSARLPYGETFFHHPTGRYSDGPDSLGLPLVQPYLGGDGRSFSKGVNFAVAGATALDYEYLEKRGIHNPLTNVSLGTQLDWFKQILAKHSDLQLSILYYQELIKLGAETMVVPGNFPIGCLPVYLTQYMTSNGKDYNSKTGCLNWLNKISEYYNELLRKELSRIRELHPNVTIIYADSYNVALRFYLYPNEFGFSKGILRACCGTGGIYNYNASAECGIVPSTSCDDPSSLASWDGMHFTEAAYRVIAQGLLEGPYTTPQFRTVCPSISRHPGFSSI